MMYSVVLYLIVASPFSMVVYEIRDHLIFSEVPIVECTGQKFVNEVTGEKRMSYVCKTDDWFREETGQEIVQITIEGLYEA